MKLELSSHLERAFAANMFRARAIRQRKLADERSKSSIRAELVAEADYCEAMAQKIDDGEDANGAEREPVRATPRLDIDAVDAP